MDPLHIEDPHPRFLNGIFFALALVLAICQAGCGSVVGSLSSATPPAATDLTAADVTTLTQTAAQAADPNTMVIAIVDRAGRVLGVYRKPSAPAFAVGNFGAQVDTNELAVSLAHSRIFQQRPGAAFFAHGSLHQRNPFSAGHYQHAQRRALRNRKRFRRIRHAP